jgi:hypothetical protein
MYLLEIEPLDLGPDVRAIALELVEDEENREPLRGPEAAEIWSSVLSAAASDEPWALDFPSHLGRVREYCGRHGISFREPNPHLIVIPPPALETLHLLIERFEGETFGARAGGLVLTGDASLEGELALRGLDAYHGRFVEYYFCAVCDFVNGSLVLLSDKLWASEIVRRVRPRLVELEVKLGLPS